jgi:hypothetical protein
MGGEDVRALRGVLHVVFAGKLLGIHGSSIVQILALCRHTRHLCIDDASSS